MELSNTTGGRSSASTDNTKLTRERVQAMADAPEMIAAANAVAFCMADVAVKTPIVEAYQRQLLAKGQWLMAQAFVDPGEERPVILDPKLSYLLEEEDAKTFQAQCAAQAAAAGLATRIPGNCPKTESDNQRYVLELHLLKLARQYTGVDPMSIYQPAARKAYVETLMRFLGPQLKSQLTADFRYVEGVMAARRAGTGADRALD